MSTATQAHIRCGNCKGKHSTIAEVRDCHSGIKQCMSITPHGQHTNPVTGLTCPGYTPPVMSTSSVAEAATESWRTKWVTPAQREEVKRLGGDVGRTYRAGQNRGTVSDYIDQLKKGTATVNDPITTAPNRRTTLIPMDLLTSVPDGYYASRPDSDHEYTFFRVSHPKSGQYKGSLKIQTQHGPDLDLFLVVWPSGSLTVYDKRPEQDFLLVTVDPNGCGLAYASKIGRCCLCGTELTDARSRWYGIGPDCEKKKSWRADPIIRAVEETKGPFRYGADI